MPSGLSHDLASHGHGRGELALHAAARRNSAGVIRALLEHGSRCLDLECSEGAALHLAAAAGAVEAMGVLLLAGADASLPRLSDGLTPLHLACAAGHAAAAQLLLNHGADPRVAAASGETPLHTACAAGHTDATLALARHNPGLLSLQPDRPADLGTPLHVLARSGCTTTLRALLGRPQLMLAAALQAQAGHGHTPLVAACAAGQLGAVRLLLDQQPPPLLESCALPALMAASEGGYLDVLRLLLERGAAAAVQWEGEPAVGLRPGRHPITMAVQRGDRQMAQCLLDAGVPLPALVLADAVCRGDSALLQLLLEAGADPSGPHAAGPNCQPLFDAALRPGHAPLLAMLLSWGLDPQHPDAQRSPLLQAVSAFNLPAVRLLLDYGASPDGWAERDGEGPLHRAASCLDLEGVQLLLGAGASAAALDRGGRSALDRALEVCSDRGALELTAAAWPDPPDLSELRLLLLVEALAAAGASCEAFRQDNPELDPSELPFPSLILALGQPAWGPGEHWRWPAAFHAAAQEWLLVSRGRGVAAGAAGGRQGRAAAGRGYLPLEVCWAVLQLASRRLSEWV